MHTASAPPPPKTAIQKTRLPSPEPGRIKQGSAKTDSRWRGLGAQEAEDGRRRFPRPSDSPKQQVHCTAAPPHEKEAAPDGAASLTVQSGTVRSVYPKAHRSDNNETRVWPPNQYIGSNSRMSFPDHPPPASSRPPCRERNPLPPCKGARREPGTASIRQSVRASGQRQ